MYRVNYADGEVSQSFKDRAGALQHLKGLTESPDAYLQACPQTSIPYLQVWFEGEWLLSTTWMPS